MNERRYKDLEVKIVGIPGSLRTGGYSKLALKKALQGAEELDAKTSILDLNDYHLPFCSGTKGDVQDHAGVQSLRSQVQKAHGILLSTPEYHGSFSGVLKNALDLMGFNEFEGKMMGLIGVSGGSLGAVNALNSLREIGRALHAWVIPRQVSIPNAYAAFDSSGNVKDAELEKRLLEVGRQLTRFAYLHTSERTTEFVEIWEEAPPNPGGSDR